MVIVQQTYSRGRALMRTLGSAALVVIGFFLVFFSSQKMFNVLPGIGNAADLSADIAYADVAGCSDSCGCGGCGCGDGSP